MSENAGTAPRPLPTLCLVAVLVALLIGVAPAGGRVTAVDEAETGAVTGSVRLDGKAPRPRPFVMASDPNCVEAAGRKVTEQSLIVGRGGGVANVLVRLAGDGLAAQAGPGPREPVVIEQRGCIYHPRLVGARVGQTLRVVNRDDFSHNVRSLSNAGSTFNIAQPFAGMEYDHELVAPEPVLRLRCDMHPWMSAFVAVLDHPWFDVTGEDGRFDLTGVPPGEYDLVLWHERLGTRRRAVTVAAGGVVEADFSLPVADEAGQ